MNPIIVIPVAVGLGVGVHWWTKRRRRKPTKQHGKPSAADLPPEGRGPFDGPGGEEPKQPEPEFFPGPYKPQDLVRTVPVPIYADASQEQIEQWPEHDLHLFISVDCKVVFVGSAWLEKVFLPAAVELVGEPERYHSVAAIAWEILVAPSVGSGRNVAADCLARLPDFHFSEKTKFGTFGQYSTDYPRYSAAWDAFRSQLPDLADFYSQVADALSNHPKVRTVLEAGWDDKLAEG